MFLRRFWRLVGKLQMLQPSETSPVKTQSASLAASEKKMRVLLLCSHPNQYGSPMWRRLSEHAQVEVLVAYCSLEGAESHVDPGFGVEVAWDVPLLDGYPWVKLKNSSPRPAVGPFFGLINRGVWKLIRRNRFDAIAVFTGYMCATFWIALMAAKISGIPLLYGTDATTLRGLDGRNWKARVKKYLWPWLFRRADVVIAPSSGTVELMRSLSIPEERIALLPYVVDNNWWTENATNVDRKALREAWGIPAEASIVLFCAKLQPWKRPQDLLRAFARANVSDAYLIFVGDGPMRKQLEREVMELNVQERVRFLGFKNQSALPGVYCSSDVMVLPSEYEAFGVVVNEAMVCGCPVIVSDQVGARFDLVRENETGFVYPAGDIDALAGALSRALGSCERLRRMGDAARARMSQWSPELYVESFVDAFYRAKAVYK
ncbi:MAG: glycosyltransferase family 4 protein, partial [Candidatus Acidiferrales bacterium]